jgi:hypothetical protein
LAVTKLAPVQITSRGGLVRQVACRTIRLVVPSASVVELHPVVLPILHFTSILEGLRQKVPEIVVVGGVLEPKVANVAQIFVEFFWDMLDTS